MAKSTGGARDGLHERHEAWREEWGARGDAKTTHGPDAHTPVDAARALAWGGPDGQAVTRTFRDGHTDTSHLERHSAAEPRSQRPHPSADLRARAVAIRRSWPSPISARVRQHVAADATGPNTTIKAQVLGSACLPKPKLRPVR